MITEIVIIGGGIAGSATAYYLAKKGRKVILLEKNRAVGLEASGRCACGVRQQGRKDALHLAMGSIQIWTGLSKELGCDLEYQRIGNLKIALNENRREELEKELEWEHSQGLMDVEMVTGERCRELVPGLTSRAVAGKLCTTDGVANPMLATPAFARAAERLGAEVCTSTSATSLLRRGNVICGVATDRGEVEADVVINAAGPWAVEFNRMAGCHTPIQPGLSQLIITERVPRRIAPFASFEPVGYIVQTRSGNIILGISGKPNDDFRRGVDYPDITKKARQFIDVIPWLEDVNCLRSFSGITEYTPDGEPYIGKIPGVQQYYTISGFAAQGFCVGPMAGKLMAELVCGDEFKLAHQPLPSRAVYRY